MNFNFFIGIDIASESFVTTILNSSLQVIASAKEFVNDPEGFDKLVSWLASAKAEQESSVICMESTGVYAEALCYCLHAKGWWLAVHSPLEVKRAFAPVGHKTDAVDSRQIAEYAVRFTDKLRRWQPKKDLLEQIKVLLSTREQFIQQRTADKNRLRAILRKPVRTPLAEQLHQDNIRNLTKNVKMIEAEIEKLLKQDDDLHNQLILLVSVPGVGLLLSAHTILMMASLQTPLNPRAVSAWLGISPYQSRSGTSVFHRDSSRHYGPAIPRKLLHLAARSMCTHNPKFQHYYHRKLAEGKPKKLVLNNISNKLVKIICAVIRENQAYVPNYRSVNPALFS